MVDGELVQLVGAARFLGGEALEGFVHAQRRLVRRQEQLGADLVGGGFLDAGEGRHLAHGIGLADAHDRHAGFASARDHGGDARHHRQQHGDHRLLHAVLAAAQVTRCKMTGLVRHHAHQLVGLVQPQQDAGADENVFGIGGEGVHFGVGRQVDMHGGHLQTRGARQRHLVALQHLLGFGVAQGITGIALSQCRLGRREQSSSQAGGRGKLAQAGFG